MVNYRLVDEYDVDPWLNVGLNVEVDAAIAVMGSKVVRNTDVWI